MSSLFSSNLEIETSFCLLFVLLYWAYPEGVPFAYRSRNQLSFLLSRDAAWRKSSQHILHVNIAVTYPLLGEPERKDKEHKPQRLTDILPSTLLSLIWSSVFCPPPCPPGPPPPTIVSLFVAVEGNYSSWLWGIHRGCHPSLIFSTTSLSTPLVLSFATACLFCLFSWSRSTRNGWWKVLRLWVHLAWAQVLAPGM